MSDNNEHNTPSNNNRRVEQVNEWYTNKDLFEQMQSLTRDISDIKIVLVETNNNIKKYNGLRDSIEAMEDECAKCKEALNSKISENARRIDLEEHKKKTELQEKRIDKLYTWIQVLAWAGGMFVLILTKGPEILKFFLK